jgi:hypothetical protein
VLRERRKLENFLNESYLFEPKEEIYKIIIFKSFFIFGKNETFEHSLKNENDEFHSINKMTQPKEKKSRRNMNNKNLLLKNKCQIYDYSL